MKIEQVKLTQVKTSADNPRTITTDKFQKLVNSLLVLPKMLEMRPVVVNSRMEALGGNMRLRALKEISKLAPEDIARRLSGLKDFADYSPAEQKALADWWGNWLEQPTVYTINASTLSEAEKRQFVIKDNVSFGQWDYDALASSWDNAQLNDWGVDVWNPIANTDDFFKAHSSNSQTDVSEEADSHESGEISERQEPFTIALTFPNEAGKAIARYVSQHGLEPLSQAVTDFVNSNSNLG